MKNWFKNKKNRFFKMIVKKLSAFRSHDFIFYADAHLGLTLHRKWKLNPSAPLPILICCCTVQCSVQGDPDLESFQSPYFYFRKSTLSDLAPSLTICLYVYITICTTPPPHLSPLPYCPQNRGKSEH